MKLIMRNLIVLAVVILSATSSFAENYPKVFFDENKTLVLNLNDWRGLNVEIELRDLYGEVLHSDNVVKGSSLSKKYNLKNLPIGTYDLIIHSSMKKAIYPIRITAGAVEMLPVENPVVFKPTLKYNEKYLEFNQLALGRKITVNISDAKGTFFTKSYKDIASINAKFDVTALPEGHYTVAVVGNNQYDTFYFQK